MNNAVYGLIEAGGTKFVLGTADAGGRIINRHRVETTLPQETVSRTIEWLTEQGSIAAIGLATFGPVELDPAKPEWGHMLQTPKPGWSEADLAGPLQRHFGCPVVVDTDVNAAAMAEARWGAGRGHEIVIYFTVGTGIGGGAVIHGKGLHGLGHPEMGHIRVARHKNDIDFAGVCPFHGDCLEGLASGPAISARWGASLSQLAPDHPGQKIIAHYLGQAVIAMQAIFEPGKIIFGGGVMGTPGLLDKVVTAAKDLGAGYFRTDAAVIISLPQLGDDTGLMGALALALNSTSE